MSKYNALANDRLAYANTSVFDVEVSCSLSSYFFVDQVCDQLVQWMIKSAQRVRIVLVYR